MNYHDNVKARVQQMIGCTEDVAQGIITAWEQRQMDAGENGIEYFEDQEEPARKVAGIILDMPFE